MWSVEVLKYPRGKRLDGATTFKEFSDCCLRSSWLLALDTNSWSSEVCKSLHKFQSLLMFRNYSTHVGRQRTSCSNSHIYSRLPASIRSKLVARKINIAWKTFFMNRRRCGRHLSPGHSDSDPQTCHASWNLVQPLQLLGAPQKCSKFQQGSEVQTKQCHCAPQSPCRETLVLCRVPSLQRQRKSMPWRIQFPSKTANLKWRRISWWTYKS